MDNYRLELSKYRLEKAKEDLMISKLNFENSYYNGAVNRSYYAIFHAIRAILAIDGFDSKKHSGVIAYFIKQYIKTGVFETELSDIILQANNIRHESDYEDFYYASKEEADNQIKNAEIFISKIEQYLTQIYNNT